VNVGAQPPIVTTETAVASVAAAQRARPDLSQSVATNPSPSATSSRDASLFATTTVSSAKRTNAPDGKMPAKAERGLLDRRSRRHAPARKTRHDMAGPEIDDNEVDPLGRSDRT